MSDEDDDDDERLESADASPGSDTRAIEPNRASSARDSREDEDDEEREEQEDDEEREEQEDDDEEKIGEEGEHESAATGTSRTASQHVAEPEGGDDSPELQGVSLALEEEEEDEEAATTAAAATAASTSSSAVLAAQTMSLGQSEPSPSPAWSAQTSRQGSTSEGDIQRVAAAVATKPDSGKDVPGMAQPTTPRKLASESNKRLQPHSQQASSSEESVGPPSPEAPAAEVRVPPGGVLRPAPKHSVFKRLYAQHAVKLEKLNRARAEIEEAEAKQLHEMVHQTVRRGKPTEAEAISSRLYQQAELQRLRMEKLQQEKELAEAKSVGSPTPAKEKFQEKSGPMVWNRLFVSASQREERLEKERSQNAEREQQWMAIHSVHRDQMEQRSARRRCGEAEAYQRLYEDAAQRTERLQRQREKRDEVQCQSARELSMQGLGAPSPDDVTQRLFKDWLHRQERIEANRQKTEQDRRELAKTVEPMEKSGSQRYLLLYDDFARRQDELRIRQEREARNAVIEQRLQHLVAAAQRRAFTEKYPEREPLFYNALKKGPSVGDTLGRLEGSSWSPPPDAAVVFQRYEDIEEMARPTPRGKDRCEVQRAWMQPSASAPSLPRSGAEGRPQKLPSGSNDGSSKMPPSARQGDCTPRRAAAQQRQQQQRQQPGTGGVQRAAPGTMPDPPSEAPLTPRRQGGAAAPGSAVAWARQQREKPLASVPKGSPPSPLRTRPGTSSSCAGVACPTQYAASTPRPGTASGVFEACSPRHAVLLARARAWEMNSSGHSLNEGMSPPPAGSAGTPSAQCRKGKDEAVPSRVLHERPPQQQQQVQDRKLKGGGDSIDSMKLSAPALMTSLVEEGARRALFQNEASASDPPHGPLHVAVSRARGAASARAV